MAGNTFGQSFKIMTFGESHGGAVGVIIDGMTPGIKLDVEDVQKQLDRRKPGQSSITTSRKEEDKVLIMSGIFEGKTTGTSLFMILYNKDARPEAYDNIKSLFRPGHADYTYLKKYGIRDHRGSGRASGRETAARVAAGAVARKMLENKGIDITAYTIEAAGISCTSFDQSEIEKNPVRACDPIAAVKIAKKIEELAEKGDSCGGIIECSIKGVDAGLGEPVFDKLDADLAKAMLSLGAVKGIEFGAGFKSVKMLGSENNDSMNKNGFMTNNSGGILGGISTGQDIIFRIAIKPTSSISVPQNTINIYGEETQIITTGRHDPCICPRIVPVVEAMSAIVILDHYKRLIAMKSDLK